MFQLHIEMEVEQLMRAKGLAPEEARRQALVAFGGVEMHKEVLRDGGGLAWLGGFALDLKLAARLLARYPWLTVVGCAAMAFGITAGVSGFELRTQLVNPSLPLDEGSQIVGLRNWAPRGIVPRRRPPPTLPAGATRSRAFGTSARSACFAETSSQARADPRPWRWRP